MQELANRLAWVHQRRHRFRVHDEDGPLEQDLIPTSDQRRHLVAVGQGLGRDRHLQHRLERVDQALGQRDAVGDLWRAVSNHTGCGGVADFG
jgi:hypothetical protein